MTGPWIRVETRGEVAHLRADQVTVSGTRADVVDALERTLAELRARTS